MSPAKASCSWPCRLEFRASGWCSTATTSRIRELEAAAEAKVGRVVVDSFDEIDRITDVWARTGHRFDVLIRVTPGVEAHTHHYVATGQDDSKFGFTLSNGTATLAVSSIRSNPAMNLLGVHVHIGSQVFLVSSFAAALGAVAEFVKVHRMEELSMGGGLGVAYIIGERAPSISEYAGVLKQAAAEQGLSVRLSAEPGRAIAAQAALTIYTVGTVKSVPARTYLAVDGGMSDNPRPVLYGSGYEAFLLRSPTGRPAPAGPHRGKALRERRCADQRRPGARRHCRRRLPRHPGHWRIRPLDGFQLQQGAAAPRWSLLLTARSRVVVERESLDDLIRLDRL